MRPFLHQCLLPLWLLLVMLGQVAHASAQASPPVVVVRVDPAAEAISQQLEQALGGTELMRDPGYLVEARKRNMQPASEGALETLIPMIGAGLALVPRAIDTVALELEFRDGKSGASLGTASIPLSNGQLGWAGRRALVAETGARMNGSAGADSPEPTDADYDPTAGDGGEADTFEEEGGTDEESALELRVGAGIGMGTRALEWPDEMGPLTASTGAFAAVELDTSLDFVLDPGFSLATAFVYQTSFMHEVTELQVAGPGRTMAIRIHRFEGVLVPTLRLGDDGALRLWAALGYGVRDLSPEVHHLLTPTYTLSGPLVRLGLRLPLSGQDVMLVLEPELQWLMQVGDDLEERGIDGSALAFGGQAALEVQIADGLFLMLRYRESHALLSSVRDGDAGDVERFATAGLMREY